MSHSITGEILRVNTDILITGVDTFDGIDSEGAGSVIVGSRIGVSLRLDPQSDLLATLESAYNAGTVLDFDVTAGDGDTTPISATVTNWSVQSGQFVTDQVLATFTLSVTDSEIGAGSGGGGGGGDSDPDFASVKLLLHFDGTNGQTTFTDSSSLAAPLLRNNDTEIVSTDQSVFGGSSLFLDWVDHNNNSISTNANHRADYDISAGGDFTIECFIYPLDADNWYGICGMEGVTATRVWGLFMFATGYVVFNVKDVNGDEVIRIHGTNIALNEWTHLAGVRHGDDYTLYVDGVSVATATSSTAPDQTSNTGNQIIVGGCPGVTSFKGYIDEFRYTNGVARYRANFTPPTAPFPDS